MTAVLAQGIFVTLGRGVCGSSPSLPRRPPVAEPRFAVAKLKLPRAGYFPTQKAFVFKEHGIVTRSGVRISYADKMIVTTVKDSDDVSYRACSKQGFQNKNWFRHYFAIAAKNSPNDVS